MATSPNPASALMWFFIVTTIFSIAEYKSPDNTTALTGVYILLLIVGEFFVNLSLTNAMCGEKQWGTAFNVTLVPWVVIFGLLKLMLSMFPGWKRPFSNTFGYGVALMSGLTPLVREIFKAQVEGHADGTATEKALGYIYRDQSLLINEIGPEKYDFDNFWDSMKGAMNADVHQQGKGAAEDANNPNNLYNKLYSLIRLKDVTAEYIWYMLTGALVTSISYNYLVNVGCKHSAKEMINRRNAYSKMVQKEEDKKKAEEKHKIHYTSAQ
jgi:hypothetical protein